MNKYRNRRVTVDGISFDSVREAQRYRELKLLERSGKISGLELQKKFVLIPAQYGECAQTQQEAPQTHGKGKPSQLPAKSQSTRHRQSVRRCVERECAYYADYFYCDGNGNQVVEDVKGVRTKEYIVKRKLMLAVHGIRIHEI